MGPVQGRALVLSAGVGWVMCGYLSAGRRGGSLYDQSPALGHVIGPTTGQGGLVQLVSAQPPSRSPWECGGHRF